MSLMYILALKQTAPVDSETQAEIQAEASTESPEPVSIEAGGQAVVPSLGARGEGAWKHRP